MSRLVDTTGTKGYEGLLSRLVSPTGTKGLGPPAYPASRWTRDKSHLLSRAQRLSGQMTWNKGMFCSSGCCLPLTGRGRGCRDASGRGCLPRVVACGCGMGHPAGRGPAHRASRRWIPALVGWAPHLLIGEGSSRGLGSIDDVADGGCRGRGGRELEKF